MTTFEKVKEAIVVALRCEEDIVTMDASIADDLGADSLDVMDLIIELEETYDVKIEDSKLKTIKTVGDIVAVVDELAG